MKNLKEAFLAKYPQNGILAAKWETATGTPFAWESLTKPNMAVFTDWMCENMARSSARQYCAKLKAVVETYAEELDMPRGWRKSLSVKDDASEQIYLTDDELKRIIAYKPDTQTESVVQQQFILSALIGARHGDIVRLTPNNIRGEYVCYVSEKTHIKAQVPLSDIAGRIINGQFSHSGTDYEIMAYSKVVSDTTFNETIRRICQMCDIDEILTLYRKGKTITAPKWKFVSSHTGRRTCASLLYLHGCDIYSISRILAHSSVEMTARKYIMAPLRSLTEGTMEYFAQFR